MTVTEDSGLPGPDAVLARLDMLTESLGVVATQLGRVSELFTRTRRQGIRIVAGLAVSFVMDVVLTIVVALLSVSSLSQASAIHVSQLTACSIGNESRVAQIQLWGYVLQLAGSPKTPAEEERDRKFLAYVNRTFAPVNCAQLYK